MINRTIISCVLVFALAFIWASYWYIDYLKTTQNARLNAELNANTERVPMDKFTTCIRSVMSESRQSTTPIDAEKAKDICMHAKNTEQVRAY